MQYPAYKKMMAELAALSSHSFQRRCFEILKEFWPNLVYSKEMGDLDSSGIDLLLNNYNADKLLFDIVVQCKGFEIPVFGDDQLKQCLDSITKFAKCDFSVRNYFLIINRPIIEKDHRDALKKSLSDLITAHKAQEAIFLDLSTFPKFLHDRTKNILLSQIQTLNMDHLDRYEKVMGRGIYIDDVPYIQKNYNLKKGNTIEHPTITGVTNPYKLLVDEFQKRISNVTEMQPTPPKFWAVVISEFGFGKTSLLLRLGVHLWNCGLKSLYIPLVEMPSDGFNNERNMTRSFIKIIFGEEDAEIREIPGLSQIAMSEILRSRADFVLLLDGIDENRIAYSHEGIKRIFDCLRDYTCPIILSMRQEFWDERQGSLQQAMKTQITNKIMIHLQEWSNSTVSLYIDSAVKNNPSNKALNKFSNLVKENRYMEFYGDIPKRPLFLSMLIDDVISGNIQKTTISQLYERYLLQKMYYDQISAFGGTGRPLPTSELDIFDLRRRLLGMLEYLAVKTVFIETGEKEWVLMEKFPEHWINEIAPLMGLSQDRTISYLMNTVLVTNDSRTTAKEIDIRFAHRSYQEYFIARRLINMLIDTAASENEDLWQFGFPIKGIILFIKGILDTMRLQPDQADIYSICIAKIRAKAKYNAPGRLAYVISREFPYVD